MSSTSSRRHVSRAWRIAPLILSLAACSHTTPNQAAYGAGSSTNPQSVARAPQPRLAPDAGPADVLVAYAQAQLVGAPRETEVQWLATDLDLAKANKTTAWNAVWTELAREVRAGNVNFTELRPYEDGAVAASDACVDKEVATLDRLHDMLGQNERGIVALNVRNDQAVQLTAAEVTPGQAAHLVKLTKMLDLDVDQQRAVASIVDAQPPKADMKADKDARMARVLDDFPLSTFNARSSLIGSDSPPSARLREKIEHKAAFLAQLVPILRPDQRERLAVHIESHERQ